MKTTSVLKPLLFIAILTVLSAFARIFTPAKYKVDTKASSLLWTGKKITGQHTGAILVSSGELVTDGKQVKQGTFDIDVTSITVTDVTDKDSNAKLVGHLKNDDFFGAEKFPKATFVISSVTPIKNDDYSVKGKLTIKGITKDIEFTAVIKTDAKKLTATAKIVVDRTQYDIKYGSSSFFDNLGNKAISNDFELDLKLVANVQPGV